MLNAIIKYLISLLFFSIFGILILDYVILPNYVGYNNEHYLPDIRGEYLEKAIYKLNSLGFIVEIIIKPYDSNHIPGTVVKMFPRSFTKVKEGRTINLTIAGKDEEIKIPNLLNMTLRNAKLTLNRFNLALDTVIYEYDNGIKENHITFQLPQKDKIINSSTKITLGVSKGSPPDYYIIPDVVNLSYKRAENTILNQGLRVGDITYEYQPDLLPNTIIDQSMTPGMRITFPASINLTVSKTKD